MKWKGKLKDAVHFFKKSLMTNFEDEEVFCNLVHAKIYCCDWEDYD